MAADGIPASWRAAISDAERSMKRTLAGEWAFFDASTKRIVFDLGNPLGNWTALTDATTGDRLAGALLEPFFQPQDLSNRYARLMLDLGNAFNVPYDEIPRAVGLADELQESTYRPFSRLYNFTGDVVFMGVSQWSVSDYAVRVSDLEGIRRAALLVAELRAAGTSKDDVAQRVSESEIVDPYTNDPFTWLDSEGTIVFHGLERNKARSQHKIIF
jgi:hypothetical protein